MAYALLINPNSIWIVADWFDRIAPGLRWQVWCKQRLWKPFWSNGQKC